MLKTFNFSNVRPNMKQIKYQRLEGLGNDRLRREYLVSFLKPVEWKIPHLCAESISA